MPRPGPGEFDPLRWWLRSREGIDEAIDRDVERSCSRKDGYDSEAAARAVAAMNGMSGSLFTYQCRYCERWHLTRRRPRT
ncbi:MAG: hypothetical protein ACREM2_05660 [Vulcanimicrobiaceae bacterium]